MPTYTVNLFDQRSVLKVTQQLDKYATDVEKAADLIASRLADRGYDVAVSIMSGHVFSGETLGSLTVEKQGEGQYILYAESTALLFFEFGAGLRGGGHPWNDMFGMGPGTYPGQTHALSPNGWWYPTSDPRLTVRTDEKGQGWGHSYGNPPYMPFYLAAEDMRQHILDVAREAFRT